LQSISWGKISTWVKENYDVISSEILRQGEANRAYRHFANTLPYSAASIKHAFERRRRKLKSVSECDLKEHGNQSLTASQEGMLLGYILLCSEMSMASQISSLSSFSSSLLGVALSTRTIQRFIAQRQDVLRNTYERAMTTQRCDPNSLDHVKSFIGNMIDIQDKFFICKDHLVNADETLLHGGKESCQAKRIEARFKSGGSVGVDSKAVGSLTPFVSASGVVWLLVLCLKLPKSTTKDGDLHLQIPVQDHEKRSENSPLSILVVGSSSGLLTSGLWDIAIQSFIDVVRKCSHTPSKEIVLLTDNLGIHQQPKSVLKALERDCYQLYFPPNCSHFIQPLDDLLFANLKRQVYSISSSILQQHLFWENRMPNLQETVFEAVMESFPIVFTVRNIKKAWDHVGVHPLQPEKIMSHCRENLGKIEEEEALTKKYAIAFEAKEAFKALHEEHSHAVQNRKRKSRRVSISTNWGESGSTGIQILESAEKKRKLNEEKVVQRQKEKENRETQRREREEAKKKRRESKEKEKVALQRSRARAKKEREKRRAEKVKKKEKERRKQEEPREKKSKEGKGKNNSVKKYLCAADGCSQAWPTGVSHDDDWLWCDMCSLYGMCFFHVRKEEQLVLLCNHEENCKK